MSERTIDQLQKKTTLTFTPVSGSVLQRKCACGRHTVAGGECAECCKRGMSLQRRSANHTEPSIAPPIVHEVLRSPGQPLDSAIRAFMESRFNHDFSQVPVRTAAPMMIQPKLTIGKPGDKYEQEADRAAGHVMRSPERGATQATKDSGYGQIPRVSVQRSATGQSAPATVPPIVHDVLRSPGRLLDFSTRSFVEERFGQDFSGVRIHTDARAAESARVVDALAYTLGRDVVFGAGQYAPGTKEGDLLLAHELTHVAQQRSTGNLFAADSTICRPTDASEFEADAVARQVVSKSAYDTPKITTHLTDSNNTLCKKPDECPPDREEEPEHPGSCPDIERESDELERYETFGPSVEVIAPNECYLITNLASGSTEFGFPTELDDLAVLIMLEPTMTVHITGYTDCVGPAELNANLRALRAAALEDYLINILGFNRDQVFVDPVPNTLYVDTNSSPEGRARNRSIALCLMTATPRRVVRCTCDPATQRFYDTETFGFLTSIEPFITSIAGSTGVPTHAVAGAIADEYNTRRGFKGFVDDIQEGVIDALPEIFIDVDRFLDIHAKLLNTLENDIGPANIKVRTALELVLRGELAVPGLPPTDIQVNRIVDLLLTERGTVEATTAVIARAERLFGPNLTEHNEELTESVLVEYFKQGDRYHRRFREALGRNPNHKACPGDGGCRFLHNHDRIVRTLRPSTPASSGTVGPSD